jgi:hypothetical protein
MSPCVSRTALTLEESVELTFDHQASRLRNNLFRETACGSAIEARRERRGPRINIH